ncbi:MAG: ABC transporter permease subunit [Bellilinea sp.]
MKNLKPILRSLGVGLAVIAVIIIYAFGFQVTKVNLDETRNPRRQQQLTRILRALAKPDILTYQKSEVVITQQFMVPCPDGGFTPPDVDQSGPYITIEPACADPRTMVTVKGFNFQPNSSGPITFIPTSQVNLGIGDFEADANGEFTSEVRIPARPDSAVQTIRTITRTNVGAPTISQTALDTWDKIVETVFLALLATTLGTLFAIPLSFIAAKNLMKDVKSPLISIALNLLLIPLGVFIGIELSKYGSQLADLVSRSLAGNLVGLVVAPAIAVPLTRWALPQAELSRPSTRTRILRMVGLVVSALSGILGLQFLAKIVIQLGDYLAPKLSSFGFLGTFISDMGDILGMSIVVITAALAAGIFSSIGDRTGKVITSHVNKPAAKALSMLLSMLAGAALSILIMQALHWFYEFDNLAVTIYWPAAIGAVIGLVTSARMAPKDDLPVGIVLYYIARTVFNGLRSIEALVWVIVFVVWVGIGPFAGVLALSLHTIAALAKLYSEQVESILPGPMEAVTATGANRLQSIVYAVVPQIIPPYISFTMYRWDINVRMSTIIGFAGGGGIGFLLYQNINLLNYRGASLQMLAIALVVASMDYLSSRLREKAI